VPFKKTIAQKTRILPSGGRVNFIAVAADLNCKSATAATVKTGGYIALYFYVFSFGIPARAVAV
jgi:hypothetical protein